MPDARAALTVILAAGGGTRMGGVPKGLVPIDGRPLLLRQLDAYRAFSERLAVAIGASPEAHRAIAPRGALLVENPDWATTWPADSLARVLQAVPPVRGPVFVTPVDTPVPRPETLRALLSAGAPCVPTHGGRDGHPVLVDPRLAARLAERPPDGGLRTVLASATRVPVAQPVAVDFDTREALEAYRASLRGGGGG